MKYLFFIACLFLTITFESHAQKYAYIDSDFILSKLPEYKTAKDRLDKLADQWTKDIDEKYTVLNQKKDLFRFFVKTSSRLTFIFQLNWEMI